MMFSSKVMQIINFSQKIQDDRQNGRQMDPMGHDFAMGTSFFLSLDILRITKLYVKKCTFRVHGDPAFLPNYKACLMITQLDWTYLNLDAKI